MTGFFYRVRARVRVLVPKRLPTCVYPGVYHGVFELDTLDVEGVQSKNFRYNSRGYSRGLWDSLGFRSHHRGVALGLLGRRRFLASAIFNLSDLVQNPVVKDRVAG